MKRHTLLVDTREQKPLSFFHPEIRPKRATVLCGDYAMVYRNGVRSAVEFERKSLDDLYGSLTSGHTRFKRKLLRARKLGVRLVLAVECPLTRVYAGTRHSKAQPRAIVKTVFTFWAKYRLFPVFFQDRREMAEYITQYYLAEWRKMGEK